MKEKLIDTKLTKTDLAEICVKIDDSGITALAAISPATTMKIKGIKDKDGKDDITPGDVKHLKIIGGSDKKTLNNALFVI